jgi:hypothetical protein
MVDGGRRASIVVDAFANIKHVCPSRPTCLCDLSDDIPDLKAFAIRNSYCKKLRITIFPVHQIEETDQPWMMEVGPHPPTSPPTSQRGKVDMKSFIGQAGSRQKLRARVVALRMASGACHRGASLGLIYDHPLSFSLFLCNKNYVDNVQPLNYHVLNMRFLWMNTA